MNFRIRPSDYCWDDIAIFSAVNNDCEPDHPTTPEHLEDWIRRRPARCVNYAFIAQAPDGLAAGMAEIGHSAFSYHADKLNVSVDVRPALRGQGIGTALYEAALNAAAHLEPSSLHAMVRENRPEGLRFAESRGYREVLRERNSTLRLAGYDPARFAYLGRKAAESGIVIKSTEQLMAEDFPDWRRKLHEVETATLADVPMSVPYAPMAYEDWATMALGSSMFIPEGYFVAVDGDRFVGVTALWKSSRDKTLETGLTGVLREYRRRGIASALKIRAAQFAKLSGIDEVRTDNAISNRAMLSINELLGFETMPANISMTKQLRPEAHAAAEPAPSPAAME